MNYDSFKHIYELKKTVLFKLYSLDYIIETIDNSVQIYAVGYSKRKSKYNSLEELVNNYTVYNEPLITLLNNITIKNDEISIPY